jgi:hypothetical protein
MKWTAQHIQAEADDALDDDDDAQATGGQAMRVLSRDGQLDDVQQFAEANNLLHAVDVFKRASALLQGEVPASDVPGITTAELNALRLEAERKWSQPKMLYFVIAMCSVAAIEQG